MPQQASNGKSENENNAVMLTNLAAMVKQGVTTVNKRFDAVEKRFNAVDASVDSVAKRIGILEKGQEDIILRLANVAYRFELVELQRRVEALEKKSA